MALGCPPDLQSVAARGGAIRAGEESGAVARGRRGKVISAQFASTAGSLTAPSPRQRMLHGVVVWPFYPFAASGRFVLIDLLAALLSGTIAIWRARAQTSVEIAASVHLAELLVGDAAKYVGQQLSAEEFLRALPTQLRSMRHVRIAVKDPAGIPMAPALPLALRSMRRRRPGLPRWSPPRSRRMTFRSLPPAGRSARSRSSASPPTKSPRSGKTARDRVGRRAAQSRDDRHSLCPVRPRARPAHRAGERPLRPRAANLRRAAAAAYRRASWPPSPTASTRSRWRSKRRARKTCGSIAG